MWKILTAINLLCLSSVACAEDLNQNKQIELENAELVTEPLNKTIAAHKLSDSNRIYISDTVKEYLEAGFAIPLILRNSDPDSLGETVPLANIYLRYAEGIFHISNVALLTDSKVRLSLQGKKDVKSAVGQSLDAAGFLRINEHISIQFDMETMRIELTVSDQEFEVIKKQRVEILGPSASEGLSNVLQYDLNGYASKSNDVSSNSAYLRFDNVLSLKENHLNIAGWANSSNQSAQSTAEVETVMYERDMNGRRFAIGMLDGWALQTLGNVSTLDAERMYGFSYGNAGNSAKYDGTQSLSPVIVYLPASGEVRLLRDARVLSIQRLPMGNHELDTSMLPSGIYNVVAEVAVGGKVVSSRTYRINKPYSSKSAGEGLSWQVWGGLSKRYARYTGETELVLNDANKLSPLLGI
ncbi:MAG: TcfC E-set like domain-containing protein, partial [Burkholderiales bacterium]|nr:TcfC E-set like domain-containing protein [Burkholderiales bacterium]